jgi:hypothetical protein
MAPFRMLIGDVSLNAHFHDSTIGTFPFLFEAFLIVCRRLMFLSWIQSQSPFNTSADRGKVMSLRIFPDTLHDEVELTN